MIRSIPVVLFLFFVSVACKEPAPKETQEKQIEPVPQTPKAVVDSTPPSTPLRVQNPRFETIACLISGLQSNGGTYSTFDSNSTWQAYALHMDSVWKSVAQKRLDPMRTWAKSEYDFLSEKSDTLFYPFSGPDFLNAYTLFPSVHTYILIALEPVGELPHFKSSEKEKWEKYFSHLNNSLQDVYKKSYFITKRMNEHLDGMKVNGTLPLITVFLKQTGHTISDIKAVRLDSLGNLLELPYDSISRPKKRPKGVKIEFFKPGETNMKTLYYFSADLGDGALTERFRFRHFLDRMGTFNSYAKSASYLMHYDEFSVIRQHVLQKAQLLLQDDTGIAFRFIDPQKWDIKLYGTYVPPVKDFSKYLYQADLQKKYASDSSHVKELSFELGYHWGSKKNNLMLFVKK
jgi:hypothetical protein